MRGRKVEFNKWIPPVVIERHYSLSTGHFDEYQPGTGCFQTGFPNKGIFHQYITETEGTPDRGFWTNTFAIVEEPSGCVTLVPVGQIRFLPDKQARSLPDREDLDLI